MAERRGRERGREGEREVASKNKNKKQERDFSSLLWMEWNGMEERSGEATVSVLGKPRCIDNSNIEERFVFFFKTFAEAKGV